MHKNGLAARRWIALVLGLGCLLSGHRGIASDWALVKWVQDGDSIVLADGRRVRYIGINTTEIRHARRPAEPWSYRARDFNAGLVLNRRVRLEFDRQTKDRYGRWLAYVFDREGVFVNRALVAEGYAYCLPRSPNQRYEALLLAAQHQAMTASKGLWRQVRARPPGRALIGNRHSKRFHRSECPFAKAIRAQHRIVFEDLWTAFKAGFAPCQQCRPFMRP